MSYFGNTPGIATLADMLAEERRDYRREQEPVDYGDIDTESLRVLYLYIKDAVDAEEIKLELQRRERQV